jgi:hypothetical protein
MHIESLLDYYEGTTEQKKEKYCSSLGVKEKQVVAEK